MLALSNSGAITHRQFRLYFAALAMVASREAAKSEQSPRYTLGELLKLLGSPATKRSERAIRADLRALRNIGLLTFTETLIRHAVTIDDLNLDTIGDLEEFYYDEFFRNRLRHVPVPRRLLRAISSGHFTKSMAKVAICAIYRCLFWHKDRGLRTDGRYKLGELAASCGISRSAAKRARRDLIACRWLVPDEDLDQWNLNRWGVRDSINLEWSEPKKVQGLHPQMQDLHPSMQTLHPSDTDTPPPPRQNDTSLPPPIIRQVPSSKDEETHTNTPGEDLPQAPCGGVDFKSENEDERSHTHNPKLRTTLKSGGTSKVSFSCRVVHSHTFEGTGSKSAISPIAPLQDYHQGKLDRIQRRDLWEPERIEKLYLEAVERGWIPPGDRHRLRFYAFAVNARVGARDPNNPGPLFIYNLRNDRDSSIRDEHEDAARDLIRKVDGEPEPAVRRGKKKTEGRARPARRPVERPLDLPAEHSEFSDLARRFSDRFGKS